MDKDTGRRRKAYKAVVNVFRDTTGDGGLDMDDIRNLLDSGENELTELHGDGTYGAGDFRSKECLELLDEADIVVTNPPFSLFREYVATLMKHDKKFVIVGNKNAVTYREIFPFICGSQLPRRRASRLGRGCGSRDSPVRGGHRGRPIHHGWLTAPWPWVCPRLCKALSLMFRAALWSASSLCPQFRQSNLAWSRFLLST